MTAIRAGYDDFYGMTFPIIHVIPDGEADPGSPHVPAPLIQSSLRQRQEMPDQARHDGLFGMPYQAGVTFLIIHVIPETTIFRHPGRRSRSGISTCTRAV